MDDVTKRVEALHLDRDADTVEGGDDGSSNRQSAQGTNGLDQHSASSGGVPGENGGSWKRERRRELANVTFTVDKGKEKDSIAAGKLLVHARDEHRAVVRAFSRNVDCDDDCDGDNDDDEDDEEQRQREDFSDNGEAVVACLELDQLRVVDLSRCAKMSFDNIYDIVRHSRRSIQELYLTGCDFIDNRDVIRILRKTYCLQVRGAHHTCPSHASCRRVLNMRVHAHHIHRCWI
jgi:hypothetical protein